MSVAYCSPLPSSAARSRWLVVVLIVIIAILSPGFAQVLGMAASATAIVGAGLLRTTATGRSE
ncbi:hypothetical protein ACIP6X_05990 [Streptomyces coeruleorubidus]|jgi:hypothetical protein|uniref:hypothetical protein n=1 Tax=Streptomyces coeruleorubidus TaxID=116188 RepID=UPI00382EBB6F